MCGEHGVPVEVAWPPVVDLLCHQQCDHHVSHISKEGFDLSLYDLSLKRSQVDTLPHCDQLIHIHFLGSPAGAF